MRGGLIDEFADLVDVGELLIFLEISSIKLLLDSIHNLQCFLVKYLLRLDFLFFLS